VDVIARSGEMVPDPCALIAIDHGKKKICSRIPRLNWHVSENAFESLRLQACQLASQSFSANS
jgi:hypothetical protein